MSKWFRGFLNAVLIVSAAITLVWFLVFVNYVLASAFKNMYLNGTAAEDILIASSAIFIDTAIVAIAKYWK